MSQFNDAVAVIPAAGNSKGTWNGLHTASCDAMFPVSGKPAIYWTLQDLISIGIQRVSIVVRERGNDLERFVYSLFASKLELHFIKPDLFLGVGYSVHVGSSVFDCSTPLLVVLGDTISRLSESKEIFSKSTVCVSTVSDSSRWCMVSIKGDLVVKLYDKKNDPISDNYALTGIYYFSEGRKFFNDVVRPLILDSKCVEMFHLLEPLVERRLLYARIDNYWLDVGNPDHVYDAHSRLIQSRSFNRLQVDQVRGTITKKSTYQLKFFDEINYYKLLPQKLQIFFPRVISSSTIPGNLELSLEYYAYPSLADLLLFTDLSPHLWHRILIQLRNICRAFVEDNYGSALGLAEGIYLTKNKNRLDLFLKNPPSIAIPFIKSSKPRVNGKYVTPLTEVYNKYEHTLRQICATSSLTAFHGDMCFSNILCEPARGLIKLIDPRGDFGRQGFLGDFRYDIAKLTHSIIGLYDWIVNDLYDITIHPSGDIDITFPVNNSQKILQDCFTNVFFNEYKRDEIQIIMGWLFLSMLPLHSDSPKRQMAMAARGLELLSDLNL